MNKRPDLLRLFSPFVLLGFVACHGSVAGPPSVPASTSAQSVSQQFAAATAASTQTDWKSWGFDLQRTGYNPHETIVGTGNVGSLQQRWTVNVGNKAMREPVYASGVMINGTPTNVLYAGSNMGSALYAINAKTGAVIWKHSVPYTTFKCGSTAEQWSVGATPAIDRGKGLIYFGDGIDQVHAVSLATGKGASGWPIAIATNPGHNNIKGGFTYNPANGMLYAETSSICDFKPWNGRIVAINTNTHTIAGTFFPVSGTSTAGGDGGGIWGGGGGSIDPATNDVIVGTGNASVSSGLAQNAGDAEHVAMLSANVNTVVQSNYPGNIPVISGDNDFDFGSTPTIFHPAGCPEMAAALNKSGMFELYDVVSIGEGPAQYVQMSISNDNGDFQGSPAYDPVTNMLYIGLPATYSIYHPGLAAFAIQANCKIDPTPAWYAWFGPDGSKTSAATPRSAVTIANGVVYVGDTSGQKVLAFSAATGARLWSFSTAGYAKPGTIVVNGIVYVMDNSGNITAFAPK